MAHSIRYDEFAEFYQRFAPDGYDDSPMTALLALIGDVSGLRVLDLACGHGRLTRELARRGSHAVGIDISRALLDIAYAREDERPLQIEYVLADVASPSALQGELFDAVSCSFGLSDIDDLQGAITTVARVLRPGGFFAFSIVHPCFPGWESREARPSWPPERGYYEEGWWRASGPEHGVRAKVGSNHRTLGTYFNTFTQHGLAIERVAEPLPSADWLSTPPLVGAVPVYLVCRCRRTS